ncbi:biofilm regulation phosphoprotein SiaC [Craterilacuibacter sp.]|uniref:biofilm regulation phosphoprotein SiaC n=1 Tax=Craterilacuibacter sp. TaxID=2870909 RepID=UPI003F419E2D
MNDLNIAATASTPHIRTDFSNGVLHMSGDSYPENAFEFFQPTLDWVNAFLGETQHPLRLEFALLYLNTSSIRIMMDILDCAEEAFQDGRDVSLVWHYQPQNERVSELAEEFKEDCTFPFNITAAETI